MDSIRQYQKLSDVKPSYQKLTLPYYSVSKFKIKHNIDELDLEYKGFGIWDDPRSSQMSKKIKGGSYESIMVIDTEL